MLKRASVKHWSRPLMQARFTFGPPAWSYTESLAWISYKSSDPSLPTMENQALELAQRAALVREDESAFGTLSTSEQLYVALLLNRADLVQRAGHTLASAITRIGPTWIELLPEAEDALRQGWPAT